MKQQITTIESDTKFKLVDEIRTWILANPDKSIVAIALCVDLNIGYTMFITYEY